MHKRIKMSFAGKRATHREKSHEKESQEEESYGEQKYRKEKSHIGRRVIR